MAPPQIVISSQRVGNELATRPGTTVDATSSERNLQSQYQLWAYEPVPGSSRRTLQSRSIQKRFRAKVRGLSRELPRREGEQPRPADGAAGKPLKVVGENARGFVPSGNPRTTLLKVPRKMKPRVWHCFSPHCDARADWMSGQIKLPPIQSARPQRQARAPHFPPARSGSRAARRSAAGYPRVPTFLPAQRSGVRGRR
jgi:hypothetical protein